MAWFETWFKNDLAKPINVVQLQGVMFNLDNLANKIGVELEYNGQPAALEGTIAGYVIRNDGTTLNLTTNTGKEGNKAWVILPQEAYTVEGPISIVIKLVYNSAETTIGACAGYVTRSRTSSEIAPTGTVIPSLASLEAAIAAANAAAVNAADAVDYIAPTEADNTASMAYATGSYFIHDGKLMKATSAIAQGATIVPYASGVTNYNCAEVPNGLSGDVYSVTNTANVAANNAADAQQLVAPVESMAGMPTSVARMTHATGSYFVFGGVLYMATADIAIGDTISTTGAGANAAQVPGGVSGQVADLKSAINDNQDETDALNSTLTDGKTKVETNTAVVLLSGKNLFVPEMPEDVNITVKGRNRFNIANASFAFSGYSTSHTLTKENGGIKVVSTLTSGSTYVYAYADYTAEYDGTLYFSCEASCDGTDRKSVRDLRASIDLNSVTQELVFGAGLLFERVSVSAGDTVRIKLYTHAGTEQGNTVYYKNIMLAYGGLYDYMPYAADVVNTEQLPVWQKVNLPTDSSKWTVSSRRTSSGGGYYCKITDSSYDVPGTSPSIPDENSDIPVIRSNEDVVSWNQLYGIADVLGPNGVSINTSGVIGLNHNNLGKTDMLAWLSSNPVYIAYQTGETITVHTRLIDRTFNSGEIIVFSEATPFKYYKDDEPVRCKVVCFGDSITGMFGNGADYPTMIDLTTSINAINIGFSGCRWTDHSGERYRPFCMNRLADAIASDNYDSQDASTLVNPESSAYDPLYAEHLANLKAVDWETVDFISLFWGTNDYLSSVIVNSADDPSETDKQHTNVEDAVKYTIETILTAYPHLRVIVITPYWQTPNGDDSDTTPDNNGKYLIDFVNKIVDVSETNFHLTTLNLYTTVGVNYPNKYYFEKDDAHPTERLKWIIAHRIVNAIGLNS